MATTKYIAIDKTIIEEGMTFGFNLFIALLSNTEMSCLVENGAAVTYDHKVIVDTSPAIYIHESEYEHYEKFIETFSPTTTISLSKQSLVIYNKASKILCALFDNPEKQANYEKVKNVVVEIVGTILDETYTIKSLLDIATHDYTTHTHSINVAIYSLTLGEYIGLNKKELHDLGESALLHDLGKSKIDSAIINKKGSLTEKEFHEIKKHSDHGYTLALKLGINNRDVLHGIRHHHEKIDGTGYPFKMKGDAIPLYARIIALCDIFDALTSRRSYKEPMSTFDALKLIKNTMNNHVDTDLLYKMIKMFR